MPSNKSWCVTVASPTWWSIHRRFKTRHMFKTRKAANEFLRQFYGKFSYTYSDPRKVK